MCKKKNSENKRRIMKITLFWDSKFVILKKYHSDHNEEDKIIRKHGRYNRGERNIEY